MPNLTESPEVRYNTLVEALSTLDARLPRRVLIDSALQGVLTLTGAQRATVFLLSQDASSLEAFVSAGPEVPSFHCPIGEGLVGACVRSGAPLLIPDAHDDPRFFRDIDAQTGFSTRSVVVVPLLDSDRHPVGALEVLSSEVARFTREDVDLLRCFASPLLLALSAQQAASRVREAAPRPVAARVEPPLGASPAFCESLDDASLVASTDKSVLVVGETGTGKEIVARFIHASSNRANGPFQPVNCALLTDTLADAQLFGCVKGAFTGAVKDTPGFVENADGGTLFLDELPSTPLAVQAKLLRFLEDGSYERVGDPRPRRASVRIVAAAQPSAMHGGVREDLLFRVAHLRVTLPPLRERGGDAVLLVACFLNAELGREPRLSQEAKEALLAHSWPGNVREAQGVAERIALHARGAEVIDAELVRAAIAEGATSGGEAPVRCPGEVREFSTTEWEQVQAALQACAGNKRAAARRLGKSPGWIYNVLGRAPE